MKRMKKMVSLLLGCSMCMSMALAPLSVGMSVQASDATAYEVTLPTEGVVTNQQDVNGSTQFIKVRFSDENVGKALLNAVTINDADGNKVNAVYFSVEGELLIPLSNFASNSTYTLSIKAEGISTYTGTFTTGEIVDDTDVADGLKATKKVRYSFVDLLRGYDLDSVTISTKDNIGAQVYLTRDLDEDFADMTSLGTIEESTQTFEITGYDIGKYQYIVVKGKGTVHDVQAYVSSESLKGIKARPVGGDNVDIRFCSWADLHMRQGQREVTNMTDILTKAKSEKFGGALDAMILVGDINCITDDANNSYQAAMLNQYARIESIMTENGYGYSNLDNDSDDVIPVIFTAGNHEYLLKANNDTHKSWFVNEVDTFNSHKVINGYHFIAGSSNYDAVMEEDTTTWMKQEIEKAMADDPTGTKPIFVFAHTKAIHNVGYHASNPVYDPYYAGKSAEFVEWMRGYPQIIYISGHNHNAMQQQTTIAQSGFTQVMLGLSGGSDIGVPGNTTDTGFYRDPINSLSDELSYHPQGAIIEVKNNVAYIYKIDFRTGGQIGDPWVIDTEGLSEGTSRAYYTTERRQFSVAPEFPEGAEDEIEVAYTTKESTAATGEVITAMDATITFPQATCDGVYGDKYALVYHLKIYDKETGTLCNVYSHYSDAIYWTNDYQLADTYTLDVPELQMGREYTVEILARNSFNKFGKPIYVDLSYMVDGQLSEEEQNKTIPEATILDHSYYKTETDGYKFFSYETGDVSTVDVQKETTTYSLEAGLHIPMNKSGRIIGTDAHNLAITYSDSTYYLTYTYTVDGVANTLKTKTYYTNAIVDIVGVCDGTTAKLYLDNVLVASALISGTVDPLAGDMKVGSSVCASVVKARAYDKALSIGEIVKLGEETAANIPEGGWVKLLTPASVTTTATIYDNRVVTNLTDGNTSTYMALAGPTPREAVIDLGDLYEIKAITFYQNLSAQTMQEVTLEVSQENTTTNRALIYSTEVDGNFTKGTTKCIPVPEADREARYIYLAGRYAGQVFVVHELRMFGKPIAK